MTSWKPTRRWLGAGPPTALDAKLRVAFDLLCAAMTTANLEYQLALAGGPPVASRSHIEKGDAFEVTVAHEWARLINTHSSFDGSVARREVPFRRSDTNSLVHADLVLEARVDASPAAPLAVVELKIGRDRNWTDGELAGDATKLEHLTLADAAATPIVGRRFVTAVVTPAKQVTMTKLGRLADNPNLSWPGVAARRPRQQSVRPGWRTRVLAIFPRYTPSPESASGWKSHEWDLSALIAYEYVP